MALKFHIAKNKKYGKKLAIIKVLLYRNSIAFVNTVTIFVFLPFFVISYTGLESWRIIIFVPFALFIILVCYGVNFRIFWGDVARAMTLKNVTGSIDKFVIVVITLLLLLFLVVGISRAEYIKKTSIYEIDSDQLNGVFSVYGTTSSGYFVYDGVSKEIFFLSSGANSIVFKRVK